MCQLQKIIKFFPVHINILLQGLKGEVGSNKGDIFKKGLITTFLLMFFQVLDGMVHNGYGCLIGSIFGQWDLYTVLPQVVGPQVPSVLGMVGMIETYL